jgi:hypothetical protein
VRQWSESAKLAVFTWVLVFALCGIGALYYFAQYRWYVERPAHGGGAPLAPAFGLVLDYLFGAWLILPILLVIALVAATLAARAALRDSSGGPVSLVQRIACVFSGIVAALSALAILGMHVPTILAAGARSLLCDTTTFERSVSPNGRYRATVIQIDCGAMSDFNRQVILTRIPFFWASETILFFNGEPKLHLSWKGRMLTIQGSRSIRSLPHPPPDPMVWGGIMIRYVGSKGAAPSKSSFSGPTSRPEALRVAGRARS